jgi:uncharacterized membrane protein
MKDGKLNETAAIQEYAVTHAYRRSCFMGSCGVYLFVFPLDFADHDTSPLASSVVSAYRFILDVGLLFLLLLSSLAPFGFVVVMLFCLCGAGIGAGRMCSPNGGGHTL